jgi:alkylation response protein AidB-like acyl-CoA dehydrogenase
MDFDYGPTAEAFRVKVRDWLEAHLPAEWRDEEGLQPLTGADDERFGFIQEWEARLRDAGYAGIAWPKEYGGQGLSTLELLVFNEEMTKAQAPQRLNFFGEGLVGPTIIRWGTDEQKEHFLPRILSGEHIWCQGFSEPNAGSDLASLQTRAVADGDEWVINGQKVWTTAAHFANWMFVLCRTDPSADKHAGISFILLPLDQPGPITVRPLRQPSGSGEFNEVFFDDARTPLANVVGGVNNGWQVANTTLGFERGGNVTAGYLRFSREWHRAAQRLRKLETIWGGPGGGAAADDPLVRQMMAQAFIKVEIMRFSGYRTLTDMLLGKPPGPESSTTKLFWSEYHQWFTNQLLTVEGPAAQVVGEGYELDDLQQTYMFARSETIWGGTSQIQRNIIGERVLGLPREPRPDRPDKGEER